jgi:hypothetical protein
LDAAGNLFIADTNNNRIRRINVLGIITTVAGTGSSGFRGDGGPATSAWLALPRRLTVDPAGDVFITDSNNHRIRELIPAKQSSTTFSMADGGAVTLQTGGSPNGGTTVGYVRVNPDQGAPPPSGFAIIDFRENNVLVSEAGVAGSPLIHSGRIYAEVSSTTDTGLAIANPNSQSATISFFFTDANGDFGQGTTTIPANGQIAKFLDQTPFNSRSALSGTFTFSSNLPIAVVALRGLINERSEFLMTTLPVTDLSLAASAATVVLPHFAVGGGWTTQIVLVNPTDAALSGNIQFRDPAGQLSGVGSGGSNTFVYSISPRSSFKFQTSDSSSTPLTGSIHVTPALNSSAPSGLAIFSFQSRGITVSEASVPAQPPGTAYRLYAESLGDFDHNAAGSTRTGLAIANTSAQATTVIVEVLNLDGSSGLIGTMAIPGNGQTALYLNQIPGIQTLLTPFRGMLRLTSFTPITVVGLRARFNERTDQLITTTPPANESVAPPVFGIFFPHFADAGGYTTQFVLFGGQPRETPSGTLQFVSPTGAAMSLVIRQ